MSQKFWNSEKLLSLTALFVSLFTLAVFIYQTSLILASECQHALAWQEQ